MFSDARAARGPPRVFYIDDHEVNLRVVSALLEAVGVEVTCCSSAVQAIEILQNASFDLILTDIHMPEMSGFDLLRELRFRKGPNRGAPVVALTADLTRDEAQYRELGFDGFIPKPVTLRPLCEVLLQVLAPGNRTSAA